MEIFPYLDTIPVSFACSIAFMLVMNPTKAPELSASTGIASTDRHEMVNTYRCNPWPSGGHGPIQPGAPMSVRVSRDAAGYGPPSGKEVMSGGMLAITQCQNPLPVGASGSKH